jgi:ATP-dependent Clp protease protease subunit
VYMRERLVDILAKHTGQDAERIRRDSDRNFFMSAEEAKTYGVIDQVITRKLEIVKK